jgi:hypothetical protein
LCCLRVACGWSFARRRSLPAVMAVRLGLRGSDWRLSFACRYAKPSGEWGEVDVRLLFCAVGRVSGLCLAAAASPTRRCRLAGSLVGRPRSAPVV